VNVRIGPDARPHPVVARSAPELRPEPVTRRYRPDTAALDALVEALYRFLMDAPDGAADAESAPVDSACISGLHE
jgi:hypothetical protein